MGLRRRERREFGQPVPQEARVGIVVLRLLVHVEEAKAPRVVPHAGDVLPVAPVAGDVVVDEPRLEPRGAPPPVDAEHPREEARDVLPRAIAHPARRGQFAHRGVHERKPGGAARPALEVAASIARVEIAPRKPQSLHATARKEAITHLLGDEPEVVAPPELDHEPVGIVVAHTRPLVASHVGDDAAW